jgi:hypothetical protein
MLCAQKAAERISTSCWTLCKKLLFGDFPTGVLSRLGPVGVGALALRPLRPQEFYDPFIFLN